MKFEVALCEFAWLALLLESIVIKLNLEEKYKNKNIIKNFTTEQMFLMFPGKFRIQTHAFLGKGSPNSKTTTQLIIFLNFGGMKYNCPSISRLINLLYFLDSNSSCLSISMINDTKMCSCNVETLWSMHMLYDMTIVNSKVGSRSDVIE